MLNPLKVLVLSATVFLSLALNVGHAALDKNVVADVNGKKISKEDFDRRYKDNLQFFKYAPPTKENVLNDIINFELAVQEAHRLGIEKDPQIQERMNTVLYQALVERQLSGKFKSAVDVSEKDAKDYCRKNPAVRISHIYVPLKPASLKAEEDEAQKKIKAFQAKLATGTAFDKVVASNPEQGFSASSGGDTGFANKMQLDPAVYDEARALKVGEVSKKPVRSQLGFHIVKLTGVQECEKINVPEWQRMVFDEKRAKIFQDYLSSLRSRGKVSINQELIKE